MINAFFEPSFLATQAVQVTAVALVAWIGWRLFAKDRPHLAHAIWLLVLLKCLTPPVFSSPTSPFCWSLPTSLEKSEEPSSDQPVSIAPFLAVVTYESAAPADTETVRMSVPPEATDAVSAQTWPSIRSSVQFLWFSGVVTGLLFVALRFAVFRSRLKWSDSEQGHLIQRRVSQLRQRLEIERDVRVRIVDGPVGPAVIGLVRPTILLPEILVTQKTPEQLEPLLAHELIHIRRGDLWWSLLQSIAKSLWWFHPLVWLSGRMLTNASEQSCDEETVSGLGCEPASYARALLDVLEIKHKLRMAPALPGVRRVDLTSIRMERIMSLNNKSHARCPKWIWVFTLGMCTCVLPGAATVGAQKPQSVSPQVTTADKPTSIEVNFTGVDVGSHIVTYRIPELLAQVEDLSGNSKQAGEYIVSLLQNAVERARINARSDVDASTTDQNTAVRKNPIPAKSAEKVWVAFDSANQSVLATADSKTHKIIRETLQHLREFGVQQIMVEITVLSVRNGVSAGAVQTNQDKETQVHAEQDPDGAIRSAPVLEPKQSHTTSTMDPKARRIMQLVDEGKASVLSRPRVITNNGHRATVTVGRSMAITESTNGEIRNNGSVELGMKTQLTPRLLDNGLIILRLENSIRRASGQFDQTVTKDDKGKTTILQSPVVVTRKASCEVACLPNEVVLIDGPMLSTGEAIANLFTTAGGQNDRLAMLVKCQLLNPFDQEKATKTERQAVHASPAAAQASSTHDVDSTKPERTTRLAVGAISLQMDGDIQISSERDRLLIDGKKATIKFRDAEASSNKEWLTLAADQIHLVMDPSGLDCEESIREARLQGNVSMKYTSDQLITAQSLELCEGGNISSAKKIRTRQANGQMGFQADEMQIDFETNAIRLLGNAVLAQDDITIRGKEILWDADSDKIVTSQSAEIEFKDAE